MGKVGFRGDMFLSRTDKLSYNRFSIQGYGLYDGDFLAVVFSFMSLLADKLILYLFQLLVTFRASVNSWVARE